MIGDGFAENCSGWSTGNEQRGEQIRVVLLETTESKRYGRSMMGTQTRTRSLRTLCWEIKVSRGRAGMDGGSFSLTKLMNGLHLSNSGPWD